VALAESHRPLLYDKSGEEHYNVVSAFIKSMRGSDPDASLYWLARMIDGGEDPMFVARRLVIFASEDVGLADSQALVLAVAAQQATHLIGLPEAFYALAHTTIYLATAPKSNSVGTAYSAAMHDVTETREEPVPIHLRNAPTGLMRSLGFGKDYRYAHSDYAGGESHDQAYRPAALDGHTYFEPGTYGEERRIAEWVAQRRRNAPT
jgi:putative ATPase